MTIKAEIKARAIALAQEGKGRNEIAKILEISRGSISNIISTWHGRQGTSEPPIQITIPSSTEDLAHFPVDSHSHIPDMNDKTGQNQSGQFPLQKAFGKGGPLSHFLQVQEVVTEAQEVEEEPIGMDCNSNAAVNKMLDENRLEPSNEEFEEVVTEVPEEEWERTLKPVPEVGPETVPRSVDRGLEQERVDGPAWTRIMQTIRKEKDQRHHELLLLDRRKQKLSEWKKRLEQMQYDLTVRESRILESEPFLPLGRQLQEMKLSLEDALPWIETINEIAQIRNMDIKSAGVLVAQELRLNRQFGAIQKQIERANQELALINMATMQKHRALTVLVDLLNRGVTESQIVQLINFTNEWYKHWGANNKSNLFGLPKILQSGGLVAAI